VHLIYGLSAKGVNQLDVSESPMMKVSY